MAERSVDELDRHPGVHPTPPAEPGRPRVVAVCITPARRANAVRLLGQVIAAGGSAVLVTADGCVPDDLPDGVEAIDLAVDERRVGVHTLLVASPMQLVRRLARRPSGGPATAWLIWSGSRPYRAVRPWVLWRALRRRLDVVDVDRLDHVVILALESWPITWQLCKRQPGATYGWDVPDEVYERVGRHPPPRPGRDGD